MKVTPEHTEKAPTLGPAIRKDKPAPAPVPVAPGVVRNSDGTLSTNLPAPKPPVWHPTPYGLPALVLTFDFSPEELTALADFQEWIKSELAQALVMGLPVPRLIDTGDTAD